MKVVAILQNQWFKDPERVRTMLERTPEARERLIYLALFAGCRTGRVLRSVLGTEWCDQIVWEEASPEIGGHSTSVFPADVEHIAAVLEKHKPDVVLAFGAVAQAGLAQAEEFGRCKAVVIRAPHPTARGADVPDKLRAAAARLNDYASMSKRMQRI